MEVVVCVSPQTMLGDSDPFMIVVGRTCPFCPLAFHLTFHPRLILKFLMLIQKVFGNVPKLIKSVWSLKMVKFRPDGDVDGANLATRCSRLPMQQKP